MPINQLFTDGADIFRREPDQLAGASLDGGDGIDTLVLVNFLYPAEFDLTSLATFKNIEIIRGTLEVAHIHIRADQLTDVTTFDSDGTEYLDTIEIAGTNVDLRGKIFIGRLEIHLETTSAEVLVSDYAAASLIKSPNTRGIHATLTSGDLSADQRIALYDRGIDKITDGSGATTENNGIALNGLSGDVVTYNGAPAFIDAGGNSTIDSLGHLASMVVTFKSGGGFFDSIDLKPGAHVSVQGVNAQGDSRIFVDSIEVGAVYRGIPSGSLHFSFNENATADRVQEVLHSVSYESSSLFPSSATTTLEVTLTDAGGRVTKATSSIQNKGAFIPTPPTGGGGSTDVGNGGNDILHGAAGNETFNGGAGDDTLYGGAGRDTLNGGTERDVFVFDTKPNKKTNIDRITDFSVRDDSIYLDNKIFKALGKKGSLTKPAKLLKDAFWLGTKAHDASDRIIYDNKKGALFYDADGTGHQAQIQIVMLGKKLKMTYKDFFVV